ncbi:MAG: ParB/Srx family N-terminal domain-containing protein, partial [Edaphobacter sp.]
MIITYLSAGTLRQNPHNSRTHTKRQIRQIANSIKAFGFNNPVLLDERNTIIAGRGRVSAAKLIGIAEVPTIRLGDLSSDQVRAYVRSRSEQEDLRGWPLLPYDVSFRGKLRTACRRTEKCVRDWGR